jgi:hypothetical protein
MSDYRIKVFSATMVREREQLAAEIMSWMREEHVTIEELIVTQSSDAQFHCLAVTVVYTRGLAIIRHAGKEFTSIEIFAVTKAKERELLGEKIGTIGDHRAIIVRQSSDDEFHCFTIVLLTGEP